MSDSIKIGVLGCASIAERFIIPNILELPDKLDLVGIASRKAEKAAEFANKFKTKAFTGYESLLDSGNLDAVYIPLPNSMHYEWIRAAFDRNIHVLVEKSMTCSYAETQELCNLAAQKNLALVENFQFRFHNQLQRIIDLLQSGAIGEIRSLRSSFGFPPFADKSNIRYQQELGGGALLDAGAYPVKVSQLILGNDLEVKAANLNTANGDSVDIWGGAYLSQRNGNLFSEISFGFDNFYQCNLEIWGSSGKLTADRIFTAPPGFSAKIIIEKPDGRSEIILPQDNHFQNMLNYFYNLIQNKNFDDEYCQNINQARLLQQLKEVAHGK